MCECLVINPLKTSTSAGPFPFQEAGVLFVLAMFILQRMKLLSATPATTHSVEKSRPNCYFKNINLSVQLGDLGYFQCEVEDYVKWVLES